MILYLLRKLLGHCQIAAYVTCEVEQSITRDGPIKFYFKYYNAYCKHVITYENWKLPQRESTCKNDALLDFVNKIKDPVTTSPIQEKGTVSGKPINLIIYIYPCLTTMPLCSSIKTGNQTLCKPMVPKLPPPSHMTAFRLDKCPVFSIASCEELSCSLNNQNRQVFYKGSNGTAGEQDDC